MADNIGAEIATQALAAAQPFVNQKATRPNLAKLRYAVRAATGLPVKCDLENNPPHLVAQRRAVEVAILGPNTDNWVRLMVDMVVPTEIQIQSRLN